jgi:hypothetical protein
VNESETQKREWGEVVRDLTRDVILEMRAQYLANGANAMKHWEQIEARVKAAAMSTSTVGEWASELMRTLRLGAPSSSLSSALLTLVAEVDGRGMSQRWAEQVERELGLLMAEVRVEADARRERRLVAMDGEVTDNA